MARRRRTRTFSGPKGSDPVAIEAEEIEKLDPAIEAMIEAIKREPIADWGIFNTAAPVTTNARKPDGQYRTSPLDGTEEFQFAGLRMGKRGKLIFEFRPIDPTYTQFEWDETKVFELVKGYEPGKKCFEATISNFLDPKTIDPYASPGDIFSLARIHYCAEFRKAAVVKEQIAKDEAAKETLTLINANPMFGMF